MSAPSTGPEEGHLESRSEGTLLRTGRAAPFPRVWDTDALPLRLKGYGALTARAVAGRAGAAVVEAGGATSRGTYTLRGRSLTPRLANGGDRPPFTPQATDRKP